MVHTMGTEELVVLVDDSGNRIGEAPKHSVHHSSTPLHLAFSCYLIDESGACLMTRRSLSKLTWPGVWTNSVCGHPSPHEPTEDAVIRRVTQELGAHAENLRLVSPNFRYRAVDSSGVVENEICPVYIADFVGPLSPDHAEVAEWEWVSPAALIEATELAPFLFSPWMAEQLADPQLRTSLMLGRQSPTSREDVRS